VVTPPPTVPPATLPPGRWGPSPVTPPAGGGPSTWPVSWGPPPVVTPPPTAPPATLPPGPPGTPGPWGTLPPVTPPAGGGPSTWPVSGTVYAGTNVPVGTNPAIPFLDEAGNTWIASASGWIQTTGPGAFAPPPAPLPGTGGPPPPASAGPGTVATIPAPYTDAAGNLWTWDATGGVWVNQGQSFSPSYLDTSGGIASGAAAPSVSVSTPDFWTSFTTWLSGSTTLFGYDVPNVILGGGVLFGFYLLERTRRR
jgi:hypothetical protein